MAIPPAQPTPAHAARNLEAGMLVLAVGALLLLISLFMDWYERDIEAWRAFEAWDLVLAVLAIGALVAAAGRLGYGPPRPASWLIGSSLGALLIVLHAIINPPPAVAGADPSTGLWIALVATILMTAGALMSVARISFAIDAAGAPSAAAPRGRTSTRFARGRERADEPLAPTEPTPRV